MIQVINTAGNNPHFIESGAERYAECLLNRQVLTQALRRCVDLKCIFTRYLSYFDDLGDDLIFCIFDVAT